MMDEHTKMDKNHHKIRNEIIMGKVEVAPIRIIGPNTCPSHYKFSFAHILN